MVIRSPKDFWAGLLFIGLGIVAMWVGSRYNLGTAARMGPGYFPRILGILLIVLGGIITFRGIRWGGEPIPAWRWRPTTVVLVSVVVYGILISRLGIAISTVLLIVGASLASHEFRLKESIVAGLLLSTLAVGVFVIGLNVQLPIWPAFLR
jgi:putative tricarboxylic transport membrane protein